MIRQFLLASCLVFLAACGGGGGGGGGGSTPAITFSPGVVAANVLLGNTATVTAQVTVSNPNDFANQYVYVSVVDSRQVLQGTPNIVALANDKFSVTFYINSGLEAGRHQGKLLVRLCKDTGCGTQFPGSPVELAYDINVTESTVLGANPFAPTQTSLHYGAAAPADVMVNVVGKSLEWTATTTDSWLRVSNGSGTGAGTFTVSYATAGLAAGSYRGMVTVTAKDGQKVEVPFNLEVLQTQFSLTTGIPTFNAVNGTAITEQDFGFELDSKVSSPWTATSSAPWMIAGPLSGTTPASITLKPDPTRSSLASGVHAADIVLSSPGIPSKTVTSALTLIKPTLATTTNALTFGGAKGRDFAGQTVSFTLNTGDTPWPWTLSALPASLNASASSGSVSASASTITITPNPNSISSGSKSEALTISAQVNGDTVSLPLTLNINADERKLVASEYGIALTSAPTGSVLNRSVKISDNFGGNVSWTASSDSGWLSATASGSTGSGTVLALSANATGVAVNAVSYARVTLTPSVVGMKPLVIRVGLWKTATAPVAAFYMTGSYTNLVADRLRPYVYAHNGATSIDVINAYTGQKIKTIDNVAAALGAMTVSMDGSRLYALDTANKTAAVVDLDAQSLSGGISLQNAVNWLSTTQTMWPNGTEVLLIGDGTAYRTLDGKSLSGARMFGALSVTPDGTNVTGARFDYSDISGGVLMRTGYGLGGDDGAVSPDGSRVYTATGSPYRCQIFDVANGSHIGELPGGNAYPNNVEVTRDGRVICGISAAFSGTDFWVHSSSGAILASYDVGGNLLPRQMAVTPDGMIVVALTAHPRVAFVVIGP